MMRTTIGTAGIMTTTITTIDPPSRDTLWAE
jgi:hypothetical protein